MAGLINAENASGKRTGFDIKLILKNTAKKADFAKSYILKKAPLENVKQRQYPEKGQGLAISQSGENS